MILAGDIGGTHTRLALFEGELKKAEEKFHSREFQDLETIVAQFLLKQKAKVSKACFGIAGPVRDGKCQTTNLPWVVDASHLKAREGFSSVHLLNDLEANAYGLRMLKKEELVLIHPGKEQKGNQALIAAGTGLGEAGLYWDGKEHRPFACEGGHSDFAPRDPLEIELFLELQKQFGHVSYERVVSGPGLLLLYQFLIKTGREKENGSLRALLQGKDGPKVISEWGKERRDVGCQRALEWFLSLYGAEAGNLALKVLALGGLFIGGGIAPHLVDMLKKGPFLKAFVDKGRFRSLLETIPVWVVLNDDAALLGAAYFAMHA